MERFFSLSICLALGLQGCDSGSDAKSDSLDTVFGKKYRALQASELSRSESQLSGTGHLVFADPLGIGENEKNFKLSFRLNEGASLTLTAYADTQLASGTGVLLKRQGTELSAVLQAGDAASPPTTLSGIDPSGLMTLRADIHNNEDPAHILIWPETAEAFSEDAAVLNSEAGPEVPGKGKGRFWGFKLAGATVESVELDDPLFGD